MAGALGAQPAITAPPGRRRALGGAGNPALAGLGGPVRAGLVLRDWVLHDPDLDPLRDSPRFQAVPRELQTGPDPAQASQD